ncbi:hypothetical protein F9U64_09960 [Gracilibacillus oryzae]|uniref:Restriction endonuclease n=1 Tax=Gracilibacillus oryzae TaxID=1672701 RepID=A0A7C8GUA4_9BACI|nr:hypothetical protein [Gracilibacillus oryzae]KAB8136815.1 hypothetical protein F9U64_09960 [Gracilibacillus oryzae]
MSKYHKYLKEIFSNENVFKTGKELNQMLQDKFRITSDNARKIISRACDKEVMKSSNPVTFGNGQYVYYGNKKGLNTNIVKEITKKNRPPVYHLLNLLESNNGIISYYESLKITASPVRKEKEKSNTLNEILSMLINLRLVEIETKSGINYIILSSHKKNSISLIYQHKNNMVLDCMFIPDIRNWLIKHNFIDNRFFVYRNATKLTKGAEHNNYVWDAYAYTNTTGYNTVLRSNNERDEKKTLVVIDVVVSRTYMSCDVQGFLRRVQAVRSSAKNERKILPIVVYQEITSHAFSQLKKLGFIMLNLGSIYGENIYPIIHKVKEIKSAIANDFGTSEDIIENVDSTLSDMDKSGQSNNLGNMKGDLFEALMYPFIKKMYPDASIEQGKVLKRKEDDGTPREYEYDVIVRDFQKQEIIVYEFKGRNSNIEIPLKPHDKKNTVKWFFNTTLPFAREELQKQNSFPVKGCYITTAKFSEDASKALENINTHKNVKPETLDVFYDGEKLLKLLEEKRENHIIEILKKYYIHKG